MGLDSVELVLEVEATFGFSIPDDDACVLSTVGELYDYVVSHRFAGKQEGCLTAVAFYRVRRALMSVLGMARNEIRPPLELNAIIPTDRRRRWAELRNMLGLRLPDLERPSWVITPATILCCTIIVAIAILSFKRIGTGVVVVIPLIAGGLIYAFVLATRPLAFAFGKEFATVVGLTKAVLDRNHGAISDACQRANTDEVWETLRNLIARQLGCNVGDVTKDKHFVKDLGCD